MIEDIQLGRMLGFICGFAAYFAFIFLFMFWLHKKQERELGLFQPDEEFQKKIKAVNEWKERIKKTKNADRKISRTLRG